MSKIIAIKTCICGKPFNITSKHPGIQTCSRKCGSAARVKKILKNCKQCGKQFETILDKYCSQQCYWNSKKETFEIKCVVCGKIRNVWKNQLELGAKYCGLECYHKTTRRTDLDRNCLTCGKSIRPDSYALKNGEGKYCSRKCERRPELRGKASPMKGKNHGQRAIEKLRAARLRQRFPNKATEIENNIESILKKLGVEYKSQYPFMGRCLIDFVIPELKIAIECDGDYWHSLPKSKARDKMKNELFASSDWRLLRFTETEILTNQTQCENIIRATASAQVQKARDLD